MPHNNNCHHPDHIRYGPSKPTKEDEMVRYQLGRALATSNKRKAYEKLMIRFNESRNAKDRAKLLSDLIFSPPKPADKTFRMPTDGILWVHTPYQISFPNIGKVHRDQKVGSGVYQNKGDASPIYFSFRGKDMLINKLVADGKYEELATFPILSLTLMMHEIAGKDDDITFTFSMEHDTLYGTKAAMESAAL